MIAKYKIYKKNIRPSGVVSKHTEDRKLWLWYSKMKKLIRHDCIPDIFLTSLIKVDFPIEDGWSKKRLVIWNKRFEELLEYKRKVIPFSKVTCVPQFKNKDDKYYRLGIWCSIQKQRRKGNTTPKWTEYEEEKCVP